MQKTTTFLLTILLLLTNVVTFAVPAEPGKKNYTQPNGKVLTITLHGDEFVHWAQTTDEYTVLQNKDGYYVYAIQDSKGNLTTSDQIAHNPTDRRPDEINFLKAIEKELHFNKSQIDEALNKWGSTKGPEKRGGFPTTGSNNLIMILANFSNTSTTYSQTDFDNYMNQENYSGTGSFKDYYLEVSYGQLVMTTVVTAWVTVPNTHDYYGPDTKWGEFARDAVEAADAIVDYSQFDNDGDGDVDGVAIIHQGEGQEASGNTNDIWSHSWNLSSAGYTVVNDGVTVDAYTTQPEIASGGGISTIGVMCHEFGHNLGAPDFYDTNYGDNGSYSGTGQWDMMAGGSWNNGGATPPHHNPYTKWKYFGWISPTELTSGQQISMANSTENSNGFYYYTTPTTGEYWLMENRQQISFDSYVPGHGLLIFHVDEDYINAHDFNNDINVGEHQGLYPVCATATGNPPTTYGTINSGGTPFPGTGSNTEFTDATTPASISWASANTEKSVTNIAETSNIITFDFMGGGNNPASFTATASSSTQIDVSWNASGYEGVLLAYSADGTFGTPIDGTTYSAGNNVPGGGTVIYDGTASTFNHSELQPATTYYYKIWAKEDVTPTYTSGVTTSESTNCANISTFPFTEGFETGALPTCWAYEGTEWAYQSGGYNGNPASAHIGSYNALFYHSSSTADVSKLIMPVMDFSGYSSANLSFWHTQPVWTPDQDELRVYYKAASGDTWTMLAEYTGDIPSWTQKNISLPNLSSEYQIAFEATGQFGYGVSLDDIEITATASAMTYVSSTTTQNNTADVTQGATDQEIIGIEIEMSGSLSPLSATSFTLNTNGSTDAAGDITNAKLYYTGTTNTFGTASQFGTTTANPDGSFTITGTQELSNGTNYFWLAYDIAADATGANLIDAECNSLTVGTAKTPTVQAPAGSRAIYIDPCATPISSFPYTQDFSSGALPQCWANLDNEGSGQVWAFNNPGERTINTTTGGNGFAILDSDNYGSGNTQNADLVTPTFDFSTYADIRLTFEHYFLYFSGSSATLSYSIDDGATWNILQTWTSDTDNAATYSEILLTEVAGQSAVKFKWNYTGTYGMYWAVDDIEIDAVAPCIAPTIQASGFTQDAANDYDMTISWTRGDGDNVLVIAREADAVNNEPFNGTSYTANAAFKSGDEIGTGNFVVYNGTGTSVNVTSLKHGATYHFALYEYNSADNCYLKPAHTGSATTPCFAIGTFPYTQDFDSWEVSSPGTSCTPDGSVIMNDCWTNALGDDMDWDILTGTTNSSNTGPSGDHTSGAGNYLYLEASNCFSNTASTITPELDLSGHVDAQLSFWYHMYGANTGTLTVQASTDGGATWSSDLWSLSGDQGNAWQKEVISLTSYAGEASVILKFTGITGGSFESDMAIDDISISASITCTPPATQASAFTPGTINDYNATVNWTRGDGDQVLVVVNEGAPVDNDPFNNTSYTASDAFGSGDAIGTGNYVVYNGTGTSVNVTNLLPGHSYYFAIYEYSTATDCYLTPALTGSISTSGVCSPCYSYGTTTFNTSTTSVAFNTIDNATGKDTDANGNAFSDFANLSTDVYTGTSYDLTVHANTDGNYTTSTMVWVDWNHDCDFDDPNEAYDLGTANNVTDGPTANSPLSITIPVDAVPGNTRMRVTTKYGTTAPEACSESIDGEVEDYTINVINEFDVAFTVTDVTDSHPITGASIEINSQTLTTNTSGEASIYLADGSYPYTVSVNGYFDGTGTITVNNGNVAKSVELTPYDPITFTATPTDVTCNGNTDGTITISNVAGGSGVGYEYSIDGGATWQSSALYIDLPPNNYNVLVSDDEGNTSDATSVTISEPDVVSYTVATTDVSAGSDGEIQFNDLAGGSGTYLFTTDGGTSWASTNPVTGLTEGDYTANVKDDNDCMATQQTVTISATEQTITFLVLDAGDAHALDGASININSTTLTSDINGEATINLTHGDYPYTVSRTGYEDASATLAVGGTAFTETVQLTALPAITFNTTVTNVTCNGGSDGEIEIINVNGGTGSGYEYSANGGTDWQASTIISGLAAGTYDIIAQDDDGNTSDPVSVTITEPAPITFSINTTDVSSSGAADGTIEFVSVTGGNGVYEYSIDNGITWQTSSLFTGLTEGNYLLFARDDLSCQSDVQGATIDLQEYLITFMVEDESNHAVNGAEIIINSNTLISDINGEATISLINGDYPYTVSYSGYFDETGTVTVNDAPVTETVTLTPNIPIAFTTDVTDVTCNGNNDGLITFINVTGGTGTGYEYSIDAGTTWQSSDIFTVLSADTYHAQVKDDGGNISTVETVTVSEPAAITFDVNITGVSASGNSDGEIEFTNAMGGNGSFEYSIDGGSNWQSSTLFAGLAEGTYDAVVRDGNLCLSATQTVTIGVGTTTQTVTFIIEDASTLNAIEGASISINSTSLLTDASGNATIDLVNGIYSYTVNKNGYHAASGSVNVSGAELTETVQLNPILPVTFTATSTNVTCNGGADGIITISGVSGGSGTGYEYSVDGGTTWETNSTFTGLTAGTYNVVVQDDVGNTSEISVITITEPAAISFDVSIIGVSISGASDGEIIFTNTTGGSGTYEYSIDGGMTWQGSANFTSLSEGSYSAIVRDDYGCMSNLQTVTVGIGTTEYTVTFMVQNADDSQPIDAATISINSTTLTTSATGEATIDLTNGSYSYTIMKTGFQDATGSINVNGTADSETVLLTPIYPVTFTATPTDVTCNGGANGIISIAGVSGGTGSGYEYSNDGGATWQASSIFTNLTAGNYNVQVKDGAGTTSTINTVTITEPDAVAFSTDVTNVSINGGSDGAIEFIAVTGGTGAYEYSIDGGSTWQTNSIFSGLSAGSYAAIVMDANGCLADQQSVTITEPAPTEYTVTFVVQIGSDFVQDATVDINGQTLTTDENGEATIDLVNGDYPYTVSTDGYEDATGTVTVAGVDVTEVVYLPLPQYTINFNVTADGTAAEGASIAINSTTITTDASGLATIELTDGDYPYTVSFNGYEDISETVTVNGADTDVQVNFTGLEDISATGRIYPNPSTGIVNIEWPTECKVTIINATGEIVEKADIKSTGTINMTNEAEGLYLIRIETNNKITTRRLIIKQ